MSMITLFLLALAGAVGTLMRYFLVTNLSGACTSFPWATLSINLLGALCVGFLLEAARFLPICSSTRIILSVGLLGGFTTYSTFSWEVIALLRDGFIVRGLGYMVLTNVGGVILVCAGILLAQLIFA